MPFELRPYQQECLAAIEGHYAQGGRAALISVATGLGKTVILSEVVRRTSGRTLILAHRKELLEQAAQKLADHLPVDRTIGVVAAQRNPAQADVVVASVQTLRPDRLVRTWGPGTFDQIIVDESHHATRNNNYGKILRYLEAPRVLGVTATPFRSDGQDVVGLFERCVYTKDLATGITDGYLSPMRAYRVLLEADLDRVRTQAGDFLTRDLGRTMDTPANNDSVVRITQAHAADRHILVFAASTTHAEHLTAAYQAAGMTAAAVFGHTPPKERARILQQYHDHELQILVNYNVLTEGYDEPDTSAILIVRPTQNPVLLAQMLGRGSRTAVQKADCLVFDCSGQTTRRQLATPATLLRQPAQTLRTPMRKPPLALPPLAANPTASDGEGVPQPLPALQAIETQMLVGWGVDPPMASQRTGAQGQSSTSQGETSPTRPITVNQRRYLLAWQCPPEAIPPTFAVAYRVIAQHKAMLEEWREVRHAWFQRTLGLSVPKSDLTYWGPYDYQSATEGQQRALARRGSTSGPPQGWSQAEARWLLAHPLALRRMTSPPPAPTSDVLPRSVMVVAPNEPQVPQHPWTLIRPTRSERWIAVSPSEAHPQLLYVIGDRDHPTIGAVFSSEVAQKAGTQARLTVESREGSQQVPVVAVLGAPDAIPPSWRRGLQTWFHRLQLEATGARPPESSVRRPLP